MSSNHNNGANDENGENRRLKKRKIIKDALKELGFESEAELARESKVDQANLNRILTGQVSLTDSRANQLCMAIFEKSFSQGLTYSECALNLANSINYSRNHIAKLENKKEYSLLENEDVYRWVNKYLQEKAKYLNLEKNSAKHHGIDNIKSLDFSEVMRYVEFWGLRYDFDYPNMLQKKFESNKEAIFKFFRQGMKQNNYQEVKQVFEHIRNIAYLCDAKNLVIEASNWLMESSINHSDMSTFVMAKSALAWTYASCDEEQDNHQKEKYLNQAKYITNEVWKSINNYSFFTKIDYDVVAMFCELKLRVPLRIHMLRTPSNSYQELREFEQAWDQSNDMLSKLIKDSKLEPRLKKRFEIPLQYQRGIYHYLRREDEKAIESFQNITQEANLIGWIRVEQAAYSWLGTLHEQKDENKCVEFWCKVNNKNTNEKRKKRRDLVLARLRPDQE